MSQENGKLPLGWVEAQLGEIAEMSLGKMLDRAKRTAGRPLPYLRNINVRWESFDLDDLLMMPFEEHELSKYELRGGDVMICEGGEPGRAAVWPGSEETILFQKALHRVRSRGAFDPRWLVLHLRHDATHQALEEYFTGTTIKHLTGTSLARYRVVLPPLAEQRRIVARIEELQARTRRAREALEAIPPLLERFRQSVLAAAFRGDLTADWRAKNPEVEPASVLLERIRAERRRQWEEAELAKLRAKGKEPKDDRWKQKYQEPEPVDTEGLPELPEGWAWAALGEATHVQTGGTPATKNPAFQGEEVPFYKPGDLDGAFPLLDAQSSVSAAGAADVGYLPEGTVLVSCIGNLGKVGLLGRSGIANQQINAILPCTTLVSAFLYYWVHTIRGWMEANASATTISILNKGRFERAPVPIPPLAEQLEIARRIQEQFAIASCLDHGTIERLEELTTLDRSILAKAFRGELVPQDPNDEPASVLLERMRRERSRTQPTRGRRAHT